MSARLTQEIAARAAQLVVDEGMEYTQARHRAAAQVAGRSVRSAELPRNEELEDAVRAHIATFHGDTQPAELQVLRRLAFRWMVRLAGHRPHLGGAVWRGTATRLSAVRIDLYCDDLKLTEIDLLNQGIDFDLGGDLDAEPGSVTVATVLDRTPEFRDPVTVHLLLHDLDDLKGALRPDTGGRTWRSDLASVQRLLAAETP